MPTQQNMPCSALLKNVNRRSFSSEEDRKMFELLLESLYKFVEHIRESATKGRVVLEIVGSFCPPVGVAGPPLPQRLFLGLMLPSYKPKVQQFLRCHPVLRHHSGPRSVGR